MKLIVIIPAFNEEKTIGQVIRGIPRNIEGIDEIKIFVINDGSTDHTKEEALKAGAHEIISNKQNIGLAKTFEKGLSAALAAGADIIVNTDADGQYSQNEISQLIKPILNKKADIVIGDRQVKKLKFMKWGNRYGNMLGSWVLRKLTNSNIQDASSGFRAFGREAALRLNIHYSHTYTHETIIQALSKKLLIKEVPVEFRPRIAGKSKLIKNIFTHIKNSSLVIIRTILLYRPLRTLFYFGFLIAMPGLVLVLRFIYFYIIGQGSGKIQSLIIASILIIIGFFVVVLGLIGDLISNNRKVNEEILYYIKKMNIKR
jgi:glycosyltransferase involved in cell wall biosynthesis